MNVEINGQSYYRTAKSYVIEGLAILTNTGNGYIVPGASVGLCIGNIMVSMFAYNAAVAVILTRYQNTKGEWRMCNRSRKYAG